jgi:ATP-dependent RNA helicase DDX31/DBP7
LEAENFSLNNKHEAAKASYAAAIASARASGFIHEEGLALELAGFHYKKVGDHINARSLFNRAKQCYAEWGSQVKVDIISSQLETLQIAPSTAEVMS